jgi:hypothetical protein
MNQKREELAIAKAACEEAELNIKQAGYFCQDATELEISSYESAWPFIDAVSSKLTIINTFSDIFLANPGKFHYCKSEDSLKQYLIPDGDEEEA